MESNKKALAFSKTKATVQMAVGLFLILFFGVGLVGIGLDGDLTLSDAVFGGVGFVLGVVLLLLRYRTRRLLESFGTYFDILSSDLKGYVPDIAATVGLTPDQVRKDIQAMIRRRYFVNAVLDKRTDCVNSPERSKRLAEMEAALPGMVTVKCAGCGGITAIRQGQVGTCDYCGAPIKGR